RAAVALKLRDFPRISTHRSRGFSMRAYAIGAIGLSLLAACGKSPAPPGPSETAASAQAAEASAGDAAARGSGIDREQFDPAIRPQDDFYRHVNGRWLKDNPVPADKSNYGSFTRLADEAEAHLREIIGEAASAENREAGSDE